MQDVRTSWNAKRLVKPVMITVIVMAMASTLRSQGAALLQAAYQLAGAGLVASLGLCIIHRAINATGWGIVLRATGQPVDTVAGARVWLASEACRWLPGSLWAYGSRTLLATRRGVPGGIAAASLVLELMVTVAGWILVIAFGWSDLRLPIARLFAGLQGPNATIHWIEAGLAVVATLLIAYLASRSSRIRSRLSRLATQFTALRSIRLDWRQLVKATLFFALMAAFNGVAFFLIIRSEPAGSAVSVQTAITANSIAWLAGFFALFAPGGLVVREACLVALLSPWMPADTALVIALAWRLVQIVSEIICSAVVAAWGLPDVIAKDPAAPPDRMCVPRPINLSILRATSTAYQSSQHNQGA